MRVGCLVAAASLIALAAPGMASAHVRIGTLAVDVRVSVINPRPSPRGAFELSVSEGDRALHLTVRGGHRLVVLGYLGEPLLRLDARGLAVNLASPTAAAAGLVPKTGDRHGWLLRRGARTAVWRDPRLGRLPTDVGRAGWAVPILVDGRSVRVSGELRRVPTPSLWPWLLVVLGAVSTGRLAAAGRRPSRVRTACFVLGGVGAVAGIVVATGFAFEATAPGMRVAAIYEFLLAVGGVGFAVWGPHEVRVVAAGWLGLLALFGGLACGQVFLHGAVLSALPPTITRSAAALAIGSGAAAALLAGVYYASPTLGSRA